MSLPSREDIPNVNRGSSFWLTVIGFWLVMVIVGVTLALALGIWNLWQAF